MEKITWRELATWICLAVLLSGCAGGKYIRGPEGKKILAPPDGMTYDATWKLVEIPKPKPAPITGPSWIGYASAGVLCAAGPVLGYFLAVQLGALAFASGISLFGALMFFSRYPWAFWIPFGLAVLTLAYMVYRFIRASQAETALKAVVPAIESLGAAGAALKNTIAANAGTGTKLLTVKGAISRIKLAK